MEPLCFHQAIGEGRQAVDSKGTVTWGPLFSRLDVVVPCSPRPPMGWGSNRKRGSSTGSLADSPRLKLGGGIPSPLGVCYWRTGGTVWVSWRGDYRLSPDPTEDGWLPGWPGSVPPRI
ncbi:unnamed protein product [Arctogadus glacialis]